MHSRKIGFASFLRWPLAGAALLALVLAVGACAKKTPEEQLAEAQQLLQERNVLGAMIAFRDFIEEHPESPLLTEAHLGLAYCYFLDQDFANAREHLDKVIELSGGRSTQYGFQAAQSKIETYAQEGDMERALEEAVLTSDTLQGIPPQAQAAFQIRAISNLMIRNEKPDQALDVLRAALAEPADSPEMASLHLEALRRMGEILRNEERLDELAESYENYLAEHPDFQLLPELHKDLALIYGVSDNEEKSAEHYAAAEEIYRDRLETALGADEKSVALLELAGLAQLQGRDDEAAETYRRIIDEYPLGNYRGSAMLSLAALRFRQGDVETSLGMLQQVAESYPNTQLANQAVQFARQIQAMRAGEAATTGSLPVNPATQPALEDAASTATAALEIAPESEAEAAASE